MFRRKPISGAVVSVINDQSNKRDDGATSRIQRRLRSAPHCTRWKSRSNRRMYNSLREVRARGLERVKREVVQWSIGSTADAVLNAGGSGLNNRIELNVSTGCRGCGQKRPCDESKSASEAAAHLGTLCSHCPTSLGQCLLSLGSTTSPGDCATYLLKCNVHISSIPRRATDEPVENTERSVSVDQMGAGLSSSRQRR